MSLTNYKIFKIIDKGICFELEINTQNDQEFKCLIKFEKEVNIDGFPLLIIKPVCICESLNGKITTNVDVPYETKNFLVEDDFKIEDLFFQVLSPHNQSKRMDYFDDVGDSLICSPVVTEFIDEEEEEKEEQPKEETIEKQEQEELKEEVEQEEEEKEEVEEKVVEETVEKKQEVEEKEKEEEEQEGEEQEIVKEEEHEKLEVNKNEIMSEIFINFNKHMESIISRLDNIENMEKNNKPNKIHHAPSIELIEAIPTTPDSHPPQEPKPHPPQEPKPHPPQEPKPHPPQEPKPHPPQPKLAPHPPQQPKLAPHPPQQPKPLLQPSQASQSPLQVKIIELQKSYQNIDVQKNLVKIIIDHMRCIEQFNILGEEKKVIALNSIETISFDNEVKEIDLLLSLSSQLIDTFVDFDKNRINIQTKPPNSLSCFAACH